MKKINNIEQLREVLRNIINTQDLEEINNFNTFYDYSSITDMSNLWGEIEGIINKREGIKKYLKKDWENIKFPTIDMTNVEIRNYIFKECLLFEINLINTQNIRWINNGFRKTKNLKKISLDLSSCEDRGNLFNNSGIKEVELSNTQNVKNFNWGFRETENLERISLDLSSCEEREYLFNDSRIREVELFNTQNIKNLNYGFENCENLKKINNLYLDNCENMIHCFGKSKIKEINLYNTKKVKYWNSCFEESNIEEVELDMGTRENCNFMFYKNKNLKKINLKNCENIKSIKEFIRGCKSLDYLEINISNMEDISDFINEKNNIKYLKLIESEKQKHPEKEIKEEFNKLFFDKYQDTKPIPHIEIKEGTTFNIIGDSNLSMRLEKKEKKEKMMNIKEEKGKTQKEYNIEINL